MSVSIMIPRGLLKPRWYFVITRSSLKFSAFAYFYIAVIPYVVATFTVNKGTITERVGINFFHIFLQLSIVAGGIVLYKRQQREISAVKQKQLVQEAIFQERNHIAQELHDVMAHSLTVIVSLSNGVSKTLSSQPKKAQKLNDEIAKVSRSSLDDIRNVINTLQNHDSEDLRWEDTDLQGFIETFRNTGLDIHEHLATTDIPPRLNMTIYRIVQEALTNALRYGDVNQPVEINLDDTASALSLKVISALREQTVKNTVGA